MNLFNYITPTIGEESDSLLKHKNIQISRIISSDSLEDKEYIQEVDEWVIILEGEAVLEIDKKEVLLTKGEYIFIPALVPHRVLQTQKGTLWLAVYMA
jgi:cupin 2 domain-containing protein